MEEYLKTELSVLLQQINEETEFGASSTISAQKNSGSYQFYLFHYI